MAFLFHLDLKSAFGDKKIKLFFLKIKKKVEGS